MQDYNSNIYATQSVEDRSGVDAESCKVKSRFVKTSWSCPWSHQHRQRRFSMSGLSASFN